MFWRLAQAALLLSATAFGQSPDLAGDFSGVLGPLQLKLHWKKTATGGTEATLDSPNQGAFGLPCTNFKLEAKNLSFDVPAVNGNWRGTVSDDAKTLTGTWSQNGQSMPLAFTRDQALGKPSRVDGT